MFFVFEKELRFLLPALDFLGVAIVTGAGLEVDEDWFWETAGSTSLTVFPPVFFVVALLADLSEADVAGALEVEVAVVERADFVAETLEEAGLSA